MYMIEISDDNYNCMVEGLTEIGQIANNMVDCLSTMKESNEERGEYHMGGQYRMGGQYEDGSRNQYRMGGSRSNRPMYRMGGRYGNY